MYNCYCIGETSFAWNDKI